MKSVTFRVTGRVHGVGFRAYVVRTGESLGLTGEVWNTHDGAVEGIAQGESLARFLELLQDGPGHVESVTSQERGAFVAEGFVIRATR